MSSMSSMSSTSNSNISTIFNKYGVFIGISLFVIVAIVIIYSLKKPDPANKVKENFSDDNNTGHYQNEIIEHFPQAAMNVMYSDANGNLGTTTDLGLDYLTVTSNSDMCGNVLSQDVFGKGSQLRTENIVAGTAHDGRLHLMGDNLYMMAKNGVRIAKDNESPNPWGASNGNLIVDGKIVSSSLGSNTDWLRLNDDVKNVGRTGIHGKLVIADTKKGDGGLCVGDWNKNVGDGNIYATREISAPSIKATSLSVDNISTSGTFSAANLKAGTVTTDNIINMKNGWRFFIRDDGNFVIQHNNVDKLSLHTGSQPAYVANGMDIGNWVGTGGGTLNVAGNIDIKGGSDPANVPIKFGNFQMSGSDHELRFSRRDGKAAKMLFCGANGGYCPGI